MHQTLFRSVVFRLKKVFFKVSSGSTQYSFILKKFGNFENFENRKVSNLYYFFYNSDGFWRLWSDSQKKSCTLPYFVILCNKGDLFTLWQRTFWSENDIFTTSSWRVHRPSPLEWIAKNSQLAKVSLYFMNLIWSGSRTACMPVCPAL